MVYSPQFLSLDVSGGGLDGGGCGGICAEGIGGGDISGASIGKGGINNRDFSRGYNGGATSSSSGAGAPTNEDRKMESIEQLVLNLNNLDLRKNVLLELSKFLSLDVSGGGLDGGGCGGICAEGIGGGDISGASIGKGGINNRDFSRGYNGGATSSSSGAGAPTNEDRKMESIEQLVLNLNNLDLRKNVLLELSKVHYLYYNLLVGD
ncbi:hypothetical protein BC332_15043 [Capsicum chinense]|nr:hypothetical protein BC332_15043 [Capsicum chinense]